MEPVGWEKPREHPSTIGRRTLQKLYRKTCAKIRPQLTGANVWFYSITLCDPNSTHVMNTTPMWGNGFRNRSAQDVLLNKNHNLTVTVRRDIDELAYQVIKYNPEYLRVLIGHLFAPVADSLVNQKLLSVQLDSVPIMQYGHISFWLCTHV
uniref:Uncharacterized protein n=1 Tax=Strigamia maritima TaxID=126957 RepID=T1JHR4_STRMM